MVIKQILFNAEATLYLFHIIILFKFEVTILKIIYNMANSDINLTLKVTDRTILLLA